ncbi:pectate lyase [Thalassobellus suaedae]|uniref:Pectate lyase n=1 Tax=Thalassobellus suaedae TaxID=3074124 RepID=A0ABY9XWN3_9FLAO|nr:pectate lyase [Flavobacteriaceae bacterium HL-DH14]
MQIKKLISVAILTLTITIGFTQNKVPNYLNKKWNYVAKNMPSDWYGSNEAKLVAENVLITQKDIGGWEKNKPYHHNFSELERKEYIKNKSKKGGTFDNGSTITELFFLAKVYSQIPDERYKQAFEKGVNYIFIAQYKNGGLLHNISLLKMPKMKFF